MDKIDIEKTVMFVGDYFALTTTVILDESLRNDGEDDDDFAIRIASVFLSEHYGFDDIEGKSNDIGVIDADV